MPRSSVDENMLHVDWNEEAARIRAMENRTGSVGDCTKLASYRSNKPGFFRRRSTRRRISNAQRLADLGDFINTRSSPVNCSFPKSRKL
ncbi:Protein CBG02071 [Caenorhabditis briggsae]|uniref:Protein CBG02071 n=1 Tax=Caenorhabditis briggsae TaxID=6238 RepID=A8WRX5_CAEBR|nr:Protein CBG02071 [Caenorhabditis briggsae]CAP23233.1 Protein CBG02071 [Caenorhabditis briggsae]